MSHTGTFVSRHTLVVRRGQYVTARFYLGRGFAGEGAALPLGIGAGLELLRTLAEAARITIVLPDEAS